MLNGAAINDVFQDVRADYDSAKASRWQRRRNVPASGASADYHYRSEGDWLKLLEYARDLDRNDSCIGSIIDRATDFTVQGGFELDFNSGDVGLDDEILTRWADWSNDPIRCDVAGEMTFADIEYMTLRHVFVDGDIVHYGTDDGILQTFEAHRLRTPHAKSEKYKKTIVHGIELDDLRRRNAFYFTKDDIDPNKQLRPATEFAELNTLDDMGVRRLFHVALQKRVTQTRGISALSPIFWLCTVHDDIQFAAALKQQVSACLAIIRENTPPSGEGNVPNVNKGQYGERKVTTRSDGSRSITDNISPILEVVGKEHEKITGFNHNTPGNEFFPHVRLLLQLIGVNLGMPLVLSLMDAKETNFSGYRGAIDQAKMGFRRNQRKLITRLHNPVVQWLISQWAVEDPALGNRLAKTQYNGKPILQKVNSRWVFNLPADWKLPAWPYVSPVEDRVADAYDIGNCLAPARDVAARNGSDYFKSVEKIIEERVYAIQLAKEAAKSINEKYVDGNPVRWDNLYAFPSADGIKLNYSGQIQPVEQPQEGATNGI